MPVLNQNIVIFIVMQNKLKNSEKITKDTTPSTFLLAVRKF